VDKTLFIRKHENDVILVQVYVDDIIFGSNNNTLCEVFVAAMQGEFEMSMMGELTYYLGLQVKQLKHGTFLNQSKYCFDLLKKFKMEDCKEVVTPIATNYLTDADEAGQPVDSTKYRGLIRSSSILQQVGQIFSLEYAYVLGFKQIQKNHTLRLQKVPQRNNQCWFMVSM